MIATPTSPLGSLSLTPLSGILSLPQMEGTSYTAGTLIAVEDGVSVPRTSDLKFAVTISDPPVPSRMATWGTLKSIYR